MCLVIILLMSFHEKQLLEKKTISKFYLNFSFFLLCLVEICSTLLYSSVLYHELYFRGCTQCIQQQNNVACIVSLLWHRVYSQIKQYILVFVILKSSFLIENIKYFNFARNYISLAWIENSAFKKILRAKSLNHQFMTIFVHEYQFCLI